jgi:hypothetical protein
VARHDAGGLSSIQGVDPAAVLAPPRVSARVSGKGRKRVLRWRVRPIPGQRVTFAEEGADSANVIARTVKSRGKVRFTPSAGTGRARKITAIVEQGGAPRDTLTVARYTAPAWRRPAKPRRLRGRRRLRIPDVQRHHRARIEVAGLRSDDLPGPPARVTVRPARRPAQASAAR